MYQPCNVLIHNELKSMNLPNCSAKLDVIASFQFATHKGQGVYNTNSMGKSSGFSE